MNLFLVDDNEDFRCSLKLFLQDYLHHKVIGEASTGKEFLSRMHNDADIILMDISLPKMSGLEVTKYSIWKNFHLRIIAISQYKKSVDLRQLIETGFKGFVSKTNLYKDLDDAIKSVMNGEYFFPDEIDVKTI